jgi:vitamin B12 transporter
MNLRLSALGMALAGLWPLSAHTQHTLPETVVTATRLLTPPSDTLLVSAHVLDRQAIEASGHTSLADLLSSLPGIRVSTNGGAGAASSVFIRGAESRHTLVLVDGLRMGSASTGQPSFETLPLSLIERIEVIKGPSSALYGSQALGGVIQIFTRKSGREGLRTHALVGGGTQSTYRMEAGFEGKHERISHAVTVGQGYTSGSNATHPQRQPTLYQPDEDAYRHRSFSARLGLDVAPGHQIGLTALHVEGENEYDAYQTDYPAWLDKQQTGVSVFAHNRLGEDTQSRLSLGFSEDALKDHGGLFEPSRFKTHQEQLSWQLEGVLGGDWVWLAAFDFLQQTVSGTTLYTQNRRRINGFVMGLSREWEGHSVQTHLRHDRNSQFGNKTTGLLAYGYRFSDAWRMHASVASAFNAPTFNQLYWPDSGFGGGNPDLKPENSVNRELGIHHQGPAGEIGLTYYHHRVRDLIAGWPATNVAQATLEGVELTWKTRLGPVLAEWGIDWLNAQDKNTGRALPRRASEAGFARLSHQTGPWGVGVELNAEGRRFDDMGHTRHLGGYGLLNGWLHYTLNPQWRIELRGNNLLDRQYETAWGFPAAPASVFVALRYQAR